MKKLYKSKIAVKSLLLTALPFSLMPSAALAQSNSLPAELAKFYECREIADIAAKASCYDSALDKFDAAKNAGEITTITREQVENVERDSFGFSIPSLPVLSNLFGGGKDKTAKAEKKDELTAPVEAETSASAEIVEKAPKSDAAAKKTEPRKPEETGIKEIDVPIKRVQTFGYKKTRFFLENGQVWEQTDSQSVRVPTIREGSAPTANISRAALGSFLLRVNGKGRAIRVKRVR